MVTLPTPDRYDTAVVVSSVAILIFAYGIYSTHLVRVSAWFTIFTIYVCWMGYAAYKWTFDDEPAENTR